MANSKKRSGALLKTSLIIILVGAVVFGVGAALTSCSYKESDFTAQQFTEATSPIDAFLIDVTTRNIDIKYADEFKVDYYNYGKSTVAVSFDGGNLSVKETVEKSPFSWFNWDWNWLKKIDNEKATVYIYLPDAVANGSKIVTVTGNTSISDINFVKGADIVTTTGNVTFKNVAVTETLNIESTTGNITLDGLTAKTLKSVSTTGIFYGKNITADTVAIKITTGNISADTLTADTVTFETMTGRISFEKLTARITEAETTTGSINGKFTGAQSEYDITVSKSTGSSNVSNQTAGQGKSISVKVTTGKITLNFA
ncbi:MAG: DUF4097 domain-containing protein [Clostridiales bacterium]|jgi:hypothetical protein|nr:DUF4097 domain-containing protein [Clostridiales bacterium]